MNATVRTFVQPGRAEAGIPTLESVSPEYARLVAKRSELWQRREQLCTERDSIRSKISDVNPHVDPGAVERRQKRISTLIGEFGTDKSEAAQQPNLQERLVAARQEIADIEEGLRIIESRVVHAASVASVLVCEQIKPDYEKTVWALLKAAIDLHKANADYTAFVEAMEQKRIGWAALNPIFPTFAGDPRDSWGPLRMFLSQAAEEGWLKRSDLPADLRG
ncbi:MAG: hypothetical protein JO208_13025 [Alphaproteobacteria bacterium]|nr:hypothetical protein [Alphaproteobacteria bacterium]